jgi:hypothetical protein
MKYWNQKLNIDTIRYSGKNTYLYVENDDSTLFQKSLLKIHTEDTTNFSIDSKLIYRNPETREVIFKLDFQPQNLTTEGSTVIKTH